MKYEDAKKLKVKDKVAVLGVIKDIDENDKTQTLEIVTDGSLRWLHNKKIIGKVSDFEKTEEQKRIIFNSEEATEFDKLTKETDYIREALELVYNSTAKSYPNLYNRLTQTDKKILAEHEFVKAWYNKNLIKIMNPQDVQNEIKRIEQNGTPMHYIEVEYKDGNKFKVLKDKDGSLYLMAPYSMLLKENEDKKVYFTEKEAKEISQRAELHSLTKYMRARKDMI